MYFARMIIQFFYMSKYNKEFGSVGEHIAKNLLENRGFIILDTNYQFYDGEIDIIAKKTETIHFIEVKTRAYDWYRPLGDAVSKKQRNTLLRSAERYLFVKKIKNVYWQVDLIGLVIQNNTVKKVRYCADICK